MLRINRARARRRLAKCRDPGCYSTGMVTPGFVALSACALRRWGISKSAVARLLRISRHTARQAGKNALPPTPAIRIMRRCPQCGALVIGPCLRCRLRRLDR